MNDQGNNLTQLISYSDIAKKLGKSANTIKRWARNNYMGFPAPQYLGTTAVFYEKEINMWLHNQLTEDPTIAKQHARDMRNGKAMGNGEA